MSEVIEALEGLGYGGSTTSRRGEAASATKLSSADRKKLAESAKKKPLGSITEVVASEKTKHLVAKIVGGSFATIIAPILVTYLIKHLEKEHTPPNLPVANAPAAPVATVPPVVVATNTTTQPPAHVVDDGSPKPLVAPFDTKQAHAGQAAWAKHLGTKVETINSVGMRLTLIPPGEFLMGSSEEQIAAVKKVDRDFRIEQERPQHPVVITRPFLIGTTEVTIGQFRKFVESTGFVTEAEKHGFGDSDQTSLDKAKPAEKGRNWKSPGYPTTDDVHVSQITWNEAVAYCQWLSSLEKQMYRLPTEAEWEYACRAGTTTQFSFSFGDDRAHLDQYGWYQGNAGGRSHPVGTKLPNPFGLFDMHGNANEWCQDWHDVKWYEKSPASDPVGPPSGLHRVIRGGTWFWVTSYACRSAYRMSLTPSFRAAYHGFRIVRVLDATKPETPGATIAKPGASPTMPTRPWNTPAFQLWVKAIQALTAEKQVEAVSKKLMELNQGFDGKLTPKVERGVVTECRFITNNVTDISPVRALVGLEILGCGGGGEGGGGWGKLSDLSPLQGMPLKELHCSYTQVSDLTPLEGMALRFVDCTATRTSDLSPLRGMPLARLNCASTQVADLSPLEGMKLATLNCTFTQIADLTPLDGMGLTNLRITPKNITRGWDVVRQMKTLKTISIGGAQNQQFQPAEFWKKYDAGEFGMPAAPAKLAYFDPTFQAWVKATQALPAGQQIEAVSRKLMELNPGFDGKVTGYDGKGLPKIENGAVREFGLFTDNVMDISPVRALVILKSLNCSGSGTGKGRLTDLSPLKGMSALLDLTCAKTQVSDLSPLQGMNLVTLHCPITPVSDLKPLERMKLSVLTCDETQVLDLSPLREVPLRHLYCYNTQISDLTPLAGVRTLSELRVNRTKVTPASVAALQQALPNCKIDWDDPAKPKTPQPSIQSIDLLKLIDPKQSFNGGIWSKGPNGMTSPNEEFEWALVRVPYVVPEEYDWRIVVERANDNPIVKPANNSGRSLALHFIASGNRGSVCIDGYHNGTCALEMVDKNMGPTFQGPIMKPGKPVALRVSVRKDSVSVAADDKEILSWHGDMGRFSSYARWAIPDRQNLFIGSQASFIIHEMSVTPVAEGKSSAASGTK